MAREFVYSSFSLLVFSRPRALETQNWLLQTSLQEAIVIGIESDVRSSRLQGFYKKSLADRTALIADWAALTAEESDLLAAGLSAERADMIIENVVGSFALPLGIGANFLINGQEYLAPMAIEEPSVVAGVSAGALLARAGGGFRTGSTEPVMIAQIQLLDVPDAAAAAKAIQAARAEILAEADTSPTISRLGGGPRDIEVRPLRETTAGAMLIVHLLFDCRDAMGANAVNTAAETIAPLLERLTGGRAGLRILSNLTDRRRAWAEVEIPAEAFDSGEHRGADVVHRIAEANAFALADPYRAATHNKGIFNGIDAVLLATGNDWRAVEAGAHAWAARDGQYRGLTDWHVRDSGQWQGASGQCDSGGAPAAKKAGSKWLFGRLELPLAVGTVGGATRSHPTARVALKILRSCFEGATGGKSDARALSEVVAAVGLAQNLAALRALTTTGIQQGHMRLHARQMAVAAGAEGEAVARIADQLVAEGEIRVERAEELLNGTDSS